MIKILFICHGNICRSPMAEYILKEYLKEEGIDDVDVFSRGVSSEETGNDIYPPAKRILTLNKIPFSHHSAKKISDEDFSSANVVYALDSSNYRALVRRFGENEKIKMLLNRDVDDPWYTGDFALVYRDIAEGCRHIIKKIEDNGSIGENYGY